MIEESSSRQAWLLAATSYEGSLPLIASTAESTNAKRYSSIPPSKAKSLAVVIVEILFIIVMQRGSKNAVRPSQVPDRTHTNSHKEENDGDDNDRKA